MTIGIMHILIYNLSKNILHALISFLKKKKQFKKIQYEPEIVKYPTGNSQKVFDILKKILEKDSCQLFFSFKNLNFFKKIKG